MLRKVTLKTFIALPLVIVLTVLIVIVGISTTVTNAQAAVSPKLSALNWQPQSKISRSMLKSAKTSQAQGIAADASAAQASQTIPYWSSSFDYAGQSYPYSMIGTDPSNGSATTIVPTVLIPLKIVLSNRATFNGENKVNDLLNSPLFTSNDFSSGSTQYGDAIQRGEFWQPVSTISPDYHVLLDTPTVLPTLTLNVPSNKGTPFTAATGTTFAKVDINWLDSQFVNYMKKKNVSPQSLVILVSSDVLGTDNNGKSCCIGGYHSSFTTGNSIQTYAYGTYNDPGFSASNPGLFNNTDALSHEIAEWYNDPFGNNTVPNWTVASQPQYGCSHSLEVGDPLVGIGFDVGNYHVQDEIFFSWFARQNPSIGINGQYTYLGNTFTDVSENC